MSTITIGADVDLKTNSKALKLDTINHYTNGASGAASAWLTLSGYTETPQSGEYPLTNALSSLATYAATVGPGVAPNTGNFAEDNNTVPATQLSTRTYADGRYAALAGLDTQNFSALDLTAKKALAIDQTNGLQLGSDEAANKIRLVIKDASFTVYKDQTALLTIT